MSWFPASLQTIFGWVFAPVAWLIGIPWHDAPAIGNLLGTRMADFDKQKKDLTDQVLNEKRSLAYEAFRSGLEERLKHEGKLKLMPEKMKNFGDLASL